MRARARIQYMSLHLDLSSIVRLPNQSWSLVAKDATFRGWPYRSAWRMFMWIFMPTGGFISVVQKPGDAIDDHLTIRARAKADLVELRENFLADLGRIETGGGTDYAFRARASRTDFEVATAKMARTLDYNNYKDRVAKIKGSSRAHVYATVWGALLKLHRA